MAAFLRGDLERARDLHQESLDIWLGLGDPQGVAWALHKLAVAVCRMEDYQAARAMLRESLVIGDELQYWFGIAWTLEGLAELEIRTGRLERGVRLAGAAATVRDEIGAPLPALWQSDLEMLLVDVRQRLSVEAYEDAWAVGRNCEPKETVTYALEP